MARSITLWTFILEVRYRWRALSQNTQSAKIIEFAMSMSSSEIMFLKRTLLKYVLHMHIYIYTCMKSSFPKHNLWAWFGHWKHFIFFINDTYRVLDICTLYALYLGIIWFWSWKPWNDLNLEWDFKLISLVTHTGHKYQYKIHTLQTINIYIYKLHI